MRARAARACVFLSMLVLGACAGGARVDPSGSWTMYQRAPDHNAVIERAGDVAKWSVDTGGQINGSMAVAGDVVFVDTLAGDLLCIDIPSGRIAWRAHVPHAVMTTPLVYGGMVYVGSGTARISASLAPAWGRRKVAMGVPGGDGIYAYDAATGKRKWVFHTQGEDMPSPVVYRGTLIFANGDFHAYAVDAESGRLRWKTKLAGIATMSSATLADGRAVMSICDYRFPYRCETDALDPASGKVLWRAPFGDADASPAYANGRVFVSGLDYNAVRSSWPQLQQAYGVVAALDVRTGKPKWVHRDDAPGLPSDVGTAERAVAGTYANGKFFQSIPGAGKLLAFDAANGRVLWTFHSLAPIKMSPLYYRGRLYAGGNAGVLYVLDANTGKLLNIKTFRQPFTSSPPVLLGDTLLIAQYHTVHAMPIEGLAR